MDNKKKLLIGGGIAASVIIIFSILILVFGGEETQKEKTTTGLKETSNTAEEHTTLKEVADNDTTRIEESSDEETTSLTGEDDSKEEETTKTAANTDKETTTKKQAAITKQETTTQGQTTTRKPETTTAKQTTTKQETTTQEQTTTTPKPQSGRIKECELALLNKCLGFSTDSIYYDNIYTDFGNKFNPFIYQRDVFGWDNMKIYFDIYEYADSEYYVGDDFAVKYPDDEQKQMIIRDMHFKRKYNQAIINDFYAWVDNPSKYDDFGEYLRQRYASPDGISFWAEEKRVNPDGSPDDMYGGYKKEWCEEWCYFDTTLQKYRTKFRPHYWIEATIIEKDGYFENVAEAYERLMTAPATHNIYNTPGSFLCRWVYDAKTNKTRIFVVCSI